MMENNQVIEAEFEEVVEEVVEAVEEQVVEAPQPLRVRVVFSESSPMDFTLTDLTGADFKSFISNNIEITPNGFFIGTIFVPRTDIKYFEQL